MNSIRISFELTPLPDRQERCQQLRLYCLLLLEIPAGVHAAQYQKNKWPVKKCTKELNGHLSKEDIHMANTHMKNAQHHSLLEKCKSKPQQSITSHQSEWPSPKKTTNNKCWRGCEEKGTLLHCWWECKLIQLLRRTAWRFLNKLEIKLPFEPAVPLLCIYPEKITIQKYTCIPVHCGTIYNSQKMKATWMSIGR